VHPQPLDEVQYVPVAPHPARESLKIPQSIGAAFILTDPADPAVYPSGVGPVSFNGDGRKILFLNEAPGDSGTLPIEFMGAVARFPEQYHPCVTHEL
jgi:hypothetical protein